MQRISEKYGIGSFRFCGNITWWPSLYLVIRKLPGALTLRIFLMNNSNHHSLSNRFESELECISSDTVLSAAYRKRKLMLWAIRATISAVLYVIFWKHGWVRWTLALTAPLSLISFLIILLGPFLLKRKIEKTRGKIEAMERLMLETEDAHADS